jgi:hypothetical protein
MNTLVLEGVDRRDYPDMVDAFVVYLEYSDGIELTAEELDAFNARYSGVIQEMARQELVG